MVPRTTYCRIHGFLRRRDMACSPQGMKDPGTKLRSVTPCLPLMVAEVFLFLQSHPCKVPGHWLEDQSWDPR